MPYGALHFLFLSIQKVQNVMPLSNNQILETLVREDEMFYLQIFHIANPMFFKVPFGWHFFWESINGRGGKSPCSFGHPIVP